MSISKKAYEQKVRSQLQKTRNYKSLMQIPKITKIVLSISVGKQAVRNPKILKICAGGFEFDCRAKGCDHQSQKSDL